MLHTRKSQLMTLCTVALSVLIFAFFYLIYYNALHLGEELGDDLRLVVYLDEDPALALQEEYTRRIEKFDRVERIEFVSGKAAYDGFRAQLGDATCPSACLTPFCRRPWRSTRRARWTA